MGQAEGGERDDKKEDGEDDDADMGTETLQEIARKRFGEAASEESVNQFVAEVEARHSKKPRV